MSGDDLALDALPPAVRAAATRSALDARGSVLVLGWTPPELTSGNGTTVRHLSGPADLDGIEPVDTVLATCELWRSRWDQARLTALRAALRPDGRLLFLEPVRVTGVSGVGQRLGGPWLRHRYGVSFDRVVPDALRDAGLVPVRLERLRGGRWGRMVSFVSGAAVAR